MEAAEEELKGADVDAAVRCILNEYFNHFVFYKKIPFRLYDSLALKGNLDEEVVDHVDK